MTEDRSNGYKAGSNLERVLRDVHQLIEGLFQQSLDGVVCDRVTGTHLDVCYALDDERDASLRVGIPHSHVDRDRGEVHARDPFHNWDADRASTVE